jgi:hypothetical protein
MLRWPGTKNERWTALLAQGVQALLEEDIGPLRDLTQPMSTGKVSRCRHRLIGWACIAGGHQLEHSAFVQPRRLLRWKRGVRNTIKNHRYIPRVLGRGVAVGLWTSSGSNGQWAPLRHPTRARILQAPILILTWAALDYPCAGQLDKDLIMPLCDHTPYRPLPAGAHHIRMLTSHVNKPFAGVASNLSPGQPFLISSSLCRLAPAYHPELSSLYLGSAQR